MTITSIRDKPFHLLLIEDNPGDADLVREAMQQTGQMHSISVVNDGEQAMSYLRRENDYAKQPFPDLVLLDLNLPKMDGREVLAQVKQSETLKHLPVVIVSSSEAERDLMMAYRLQANCFVTKPVDLDDYFEVFAEIARFWMRFVKLPPRLP